MGRDILRLERLGIGDVNLVFSRVRAWMGRGCCEAPRSCQVDHGLPRTLSIGPSLERLEGPTAASSIDISLVPLVEE